MNNLKFDTKNSQVNQNLRGKQNKKSKFKTFFNCKYIFNHLIYN